MQAVGSPALYAALLLRNQRQEVASGVIAAALAQGQGERYPELYLYQTMAAPDAPQSQLERLNRFFAFHGVPPVVLRQPDTPPGPCNVQVPVDLPVLENGPLVSVLMTTFRTGERAGLHRRRLMHKFSGLIFKISPFLN